MSGFFTICFAWPVAAALWIYLHHNLAALTNMGLDLGNLAPVNTWFFATFMGLMGGFLPAVRAARLSPLAAIRGQ